MSSQSEQTENERRIEATAILRQLAMGNDPQSGGPLDPGHVALRPANMGALLLAIESLGTKTVAPKPGEHPERSGSLWGDKEDVELRELFEDDASHRESATLHERTRGGSRLVHLGLIESRR